MKDFLKIFKKIKKEQVKRLGQIALASLLVVAVGYLVLNRGSLYFLMDWEKIKGFLFPSLMCAGLGVFIDSVLSKVDKGAFNIKNQGLKSLAFNATLQLLLLGTLLGFLSTNQVDRNLSTGLLVGGGVLAAAAALNLFLNKE